MILILPLLISNGSWAILYEELVERDGLTYAPFKDIPFTGKTTGTKQMSFHEGKLYGEFQTYYDNGQLEYRGFYNYAGELEGKLTEYYESGALSAIFHYVNGVLEGEVIYYSVMTEDGTISSTGTMIDGKKHGEWKLYSNDGSVWSVRNYRNGLYHGELLNYWENGQLREKIDYVDGKQHGFMIFYDENGMETEKIEFKNDVRQ